MSSPSPTIGSPSERRRTSAPTRRHLLTSPGSPAAPPRVVLHLPDLEALSAVALGPPKPTRRRIDRAHTVEAMADDAETNAATKEHAGPFRQIAQLLRGPLTKAVPEVLSGGGALLGKTLIVLQHPKLLIAALVAVGLQLAAVLSLLSGVGQDGTTSPSTDGATNIVTSIPLPKAGPDDPIQTPLSVFGGPTPTPPQTLPGLDSHDLPTWPSDTALSGPAESKANQPARLEPTAERKPTLVPAPVSSSNGPLPTLPQLSGPAPSSNLKSADATTSKPKARLQGTIKKISTGGATP